MACTYRFFDTDGRLLYVGVADDFDRRWKGHVKKRWWKQVAKREVIWFTCRLDALYEEARAIETEFPVYNRRPGISPIGLRLFRIRDYRGRLAAAWANKLAVTRWDKDEAFRLIESGRAHGWATYEGAPFAIAVPLSWYEEACKRMGQQPDLAAMPQIAWEEV